MRIKSSYIVKLLLIIMGVYCALITNSASAVCQLVAVSVPRFTLPQDITIARDDPIGKLIYRFDFQPLPAGIGATCDGGEERGLKNEAGAQPPIGTANTVFPIGSTGIGYRVAISQLAECGSIWV